ncbi:DUF5994 family protein [Kitasatospora sp. NPDC085464]|uniref:DUF5994 family protein n=1 Tax=Kitasatospora sp. NPDC085464 TaxID=3364063 RepID=UPI0037C8F083
MTTTLDRATTPAATDSTARLSLTPGGVRPGRLDGAWWPRSRDLLLELPALAADPANTRTASELLAAEPSAGATAPDTRSDFLPSPATPSPGLGEAERRADLARSRAASWPTSV